MYIIHAKKKLKIYITTKKNSAKIFYYDKLIYYPDMIHYI